MVCPCALCVSHWCFTPAAADALVPGHTGERRERHSEGNSSERTTTTQRGAEGTQQQQHTHTHSEHNNSTHTYAQRSATRSLLVLPLLRRLRAPSLCCVGVSHRRHVSASQRLCARCAWSRGEQCVANKVCVLWIAPARGVRGSLKRAAQSGAVVSTGPLPALRPSLDRATGLSDKRKRINHTAQQQQLTASTHKEGQHTGVGVKTIRGGAHEKTSSNMDKAALQTRHEEASPLTHFVVNGRNTRFCVLDCAARIDRARQTHLSDAHRTNHDACRCCSRG